MSQQCDTMKVTTGNSRFYFVFLGQISLQGDTLLSLVSSTYIPWGLSIQDNVWTESLHLEQSFRDLKSTGMSFVHLWHSEVPRPGTLATAVIWSSLNTGSLTCCATRKLWNVFIFSKFVSSPPPPGFCLCYFLGVETSFHLWNAGDSNPDSISWASMLGRM